MARVLLWCFGLLLCPSPLAAKATSTRSSASVGVGVGYAPYILSLFHVGTVTDADSNTKERLSGAGFGSDTYGTFAEAHLLGLNISLLRSAFTVSPSSSSSSSSSGALPRLKTTFQDVGGGFDGERWAIHADHGFVLGQRLKTFSGVDADNLTQDSSTYRPDLKLSGTGGRLTFLTAAYHGLDLRWIRNPAAGLPQRGAAFGFASSLLYRRMTAEADGPLLTGSYGANFGAVGSISRLDVETVGAVVGPAACWSFWGFYLVLDIEVGPSGFRESYTSNGVMTTIKKGGVTGDGMYGAGYRGDLMFFNLIAQVSMVQLPVEQDGVRFVHDSLAFVVGAHL